MLYSCVYLFAKTVGVFEQVVHSVGLLSLLRNLCILARHGKVRQDVDHDLRETVGQQLFPVLLNISADRLHLLKVIQEDQVGDQYLVGGASRGHKTTGGVRHNNQPSLLLCFTQYTIKMVPVSSSLVEIFDRVMV